MPNAHLFHRAVPARTPFLRVPGVAVLALLGTLVWSLLAGARPAGGGGGEPLPGTECLGDITNVSFSASLATVLLGLGQSTTLTWNVQPPSTCPGVKLSIPGLMAPTSALSGSRVVIPTSDSSWSLYAHKFSGSRALRTASVQVVPPPVFGRTTVRIDWNSQVSEFVQAIATPNTTVLLADDLNMDLTGRHDLAIAYGVHIIGGRSSTNPGPRSFTTAIRTAGPQPLFAIGEYHDAAGVRISGVRIDGGDMVGIAGNGITQDNDPVTPVEIAVNSSVNVEIAHSEIYGWSGTAVQIKDTRSRMSGDNASVVWIHDNYIHFGFEAQSPEIGVGNGAA